MSNWTDIKKQISKNNFVIFGTGFFSELWYQRLSVLGYSPLFFADNNSDIWEQEIIDDIICISPDSIKDRTENIVCLVCVGYTLWDEIIEQLEAYSINYICMDEGITQGYDFICDYFKESPKLYTGSDALKRQTRLETDCSGDERIAVYTAIFGDYDDLQQPSQIDPRCDYFCISDKCPEKLGAYKWIPFDSICIEQLDSPLLKNRYCKIFPNLIFPEYDYSIYVDGNIQISSTLGHLVEQMEGYNLAFFDHPDCGDLYVEAFRFCDQYFNIEFATAINNQIVEYIRTGFPFGFGFVENSVIVRKHNEESCIQIMRAWWSEYKNHPTRDQISFMYAVWSCGFSKSDIAYLGKNWRQACEFTHILHKQEPIRKHMKYMKNC